MSRRDAIVLGAGVAGLSTALPLLRRGFDVAVIDPLPPAGGASFGNAGLVGPDTAVPIALPGMLRQVPGWLRDPLGPLSVRPGYLPRAAPWLVQWILAGRLKRVLAISDAMRSLHATAFDRWRDLLGSSFADYFRRFGHVHLWDGAHETPSAAVERRIRERFGIESASLGPEELRQLLPGISRQVGRAVFVPGNGHTVDPAKTVRRVGAMFQQEGGRVLPERALKLIPRDGSWTVMTNADNHHAQNVVVAGGAWSDTLLGPLGVKAPLESERGYHVVMSTLGDPPRVPILHKSRGFGVTPMDEGVRVAGTVEIAGRDAAPNEERARVLARHARAIFPDLAAEPTRLWMGCRPSTPDSLPVVGGVPGHKGLFVCFGHGHFGMTGGPPSGLLCAQLMSGEAPFIDPSPYSIARFGHVRS